jgi:hypothetical protein
MSAVGSSGEGDVSTFGVEGGVGVDGKLVVGVGANAGGAVGAHIRP